MVRLHSAILMTLLLAAAVFAQPQPLTSNRPADTQPADRPTMSPPVVLTSGNPAVDEILDRLEVKGKSIKGLSAQIVYQHTTVVPVHSTQKKIGTLIFARMEPNPRFLVHFTKSVADGVVARNEEYYAFDGRWYVERSDAGKNVTRREIAGRGEKIDPFELGKGPFPLPFGQKRSEILRHFEVSLGRPEAGLPSGWKHLHCVPRHHSSLSDDYVRVEIYVDTAASMPVRIITESAVDKSLIQVDFEKVNLNEAPAASRFAVETPRGFSETIERAEDEPRIDLTPVDEMPGSGGRR